MRRHCERVSRVKSAPKTPTFPGAQGVAVPEGHGGAPAQGEGESHPAWCLDAARTRGWSRNLGEPRFSSNIPAE